MMKLGSFLGVLCVLCGSPLFAAEPQFTISYWCGPPSTFLTPERFKEVKDANFTLAFPPCGGMTVEQNRKMLDYCQQAGLKAVIQDSRMPLAATSAADKAKLDAIIKDYSDHPALFGYFIVDEPGAHAFAGLGQVVAYLKEKDPEHPGYINLLPTYGHDYLGTKTYEEYVRQYAQRVKPFAISYDHYHLTNHGDRKDFYENLQTVRKVSLESGTPFWNIVLSVQHGDYRNLKEPELRYEAMQTLAYGARGLLWFTYWSPQGPANPGEWKHAMINPDGSHDPHYDMVKQVNADVLAIAHELGDAKSVAVYEPAAKESHDMPLPADAPLQVTSNELTVGVFESADHRHFALLASRNYKDAINTRISVAKGSPEWFDARTAKWAPLDDPARSMGAGSALLLRW